LLAAETDFDRLLALATPVDQAVLKELSAILELKGSDRVKGAQARAEEVGKKRKVLEDAKQKIMNAHNQIRGALQARLKSRWPELGNLLHPESMKILNGQSDQVVKWIEAAPQYAEFKKQDEEYEAKDKESAVLERTWVKYQRFIRTAEGVALAANLPKVAKPEVVAKYKVLVEGEGGCLAPAR
jgi:hypothetical protein